MHVSFAVWMVVLLLVLAAVATAALARVGEWAYSAKPLLTPAERVLFGQLKHAFPEYQLLAQVSLAQAVAIRASGKQRQRLFNRVAAKSLDFVLCSSDFEVIAVIELDDRSHDNPTQRRRDEVKDRVLAAAGVPMLRWRAGKVPRSGDMRALVEAARDAGKRRTQ